MENLDSMCRLETIGLRYEPRANRIGRMDMGCVLKGGEMGPLRGEAVPSSWKKPSEKRKKSEGRDSEAKLVGGTEVESQIYSLIDRYINHPAQLRPPCIQLRVGSECLAVRLKKCVASWV